MASKQTQISLIHAFSILKILAVSGVFSSIDFRGPRSSSITVIHNSHASFSDGEETPPHKQPLLLYSTGFKGAVSNKKLDPKVVITQISSVRHAPLIELHSETREKLQNTTILGAMGWKKEENQSATSTIHLTLVPIMRSSQGHTGCAMFTVLHP
jgi:hypothetical protein